MVCDLLNNEFEADQSFIPYKRGIGIAASNARPIVCAWTKTLQNIKNKPTHYSFNLSDETSPLSVGLDLQKLPKQLFIDPCSVIEF